MPKFSRSNSYNGKQSNENWTGQVRAANSVEAEAGLSKQLYISPSTLSDAVIALVPLATSTVAGIVTVTAAPYETGAVATKAYADALAIAGAPSWSETVSGIGQLSTTAEAQAGTDDNTAMTPLKVVQALAASLPITGGDGSFITLAASGLASLSGSATIITGATALNLASDASTGAVNIATGAAARVITIGNVTGATAIAINTGTGHFTVTTTGTGDIILDSDDTMLLDSDGVLELNSSAGVISIGNDVISQNINLGTGGVRTITIGNSTGATSLVIESGTGPINIGNNAIAHSISIGNKIGATAIALEIGTGNYTLDGNAASTYTIGASTTTGIITIGGTAQTGTIVLGDSSGINIVDIGTGEGATTVNIATGATSAKVVHIADGAVANLVTIGSATGAASLTLKAGTGNFSLDGSATTTYTFAPTTTSGTINFGGTGANTGTMTIAGGTGVQTLNIAASTGVKTVNIATGAAANAVTVGTENTTATLDLKAGSGGVNVYGDLNLANVATKISMNGGAVTDFIGTATLVGGTVTVANTNIAAGDRIIISRSALNASPALGFLLYTISAGASFTIESYSAVGAAVVTDVSSFTYVIVRQT